MSMSPDLHLSAFGIEMAPCVVLSSDLEDRMASTWEKLGIPRGQIEQLTGVRERRWWEEGTSISQMAAKACQKALDRAGMTIDDIDLFEVNEAFAPIPLAWLQYTGADAEKMNVHGGAIALGHPLGASGTKLMTTLVHALRAP